MTPDSRKYFPPAEDFPAAMTGLLRQPVAIPGPGRNQQALICRIREDAAKTMRENDRFSDCPFRVTGTVQEEDSGGFCRHDIAGTGFGPAWIEPAQSPE